MFVHKNQYKSRYKETKVEQWLWIPEVAMNVLKRVAQIYAYIIICTKINSYFSPKPTV